MICICLCCFIKRAWSDCLWLAISHVFLGMGKKMPEKFILGQEYSRYGIKIDSTQYWNNWNGKRNWSMRKWSRMIVNENQKAWKNKKDKEPQHSFHHMSNSDLQVRPLASQWISPGVHQCLCWRKTDDPASSPCIETWYMLEIMMKHRNKK